MKVILLAPGLGAVVRGTERFFLELAAQLHKAGLDATCWGTSEASGVEALCAPGRIELQALALNHFRAGGSEPERQVQPAALYDWSIYAEDQLFAIPAAERIKELLKSGERVLVYARWQGGLVDPSGAPTELLKVMASAYEAGRGRLVVYTDYVYMPIDSLLFSGGAVLHTLGPWLTQPLVHMGIPDTDVLELPMCIQADTYKGCREHRAAARRAAGIPEDAFVVLSVGAFDTTTPDKRHLHILHEILALPDARRVWWVVAGSRGPAACEWEEEAKRAMGERFVPLTNVAFDKMAAIYGMADVFALASLDETFGLVYLEAQAARLPVVAHDSPVTRHICAPAAGARFRMSLVDMRRPGAAAQAIELWSQLLKSEATGSEVRNWIERYAQSREQQFGWDAVGPQYAEAFRKAMPTEPRRATAGARKPAAGDEQFHRNALRLFEKGSYREALVLLGRAIGTQENAERWNDWATVQVALKNSGEAEQGFRRALALSPAHAQAAVNLGTLLAMQGRTSEAIPLLEQGTPGIDQEQQAAASRLLEECRAKLKPKARVSASDEELSAFLQGLSTAGDDEVDLAESLPYYAALVKAFPEANPGVRLLAVGRGARYLAPALSRWKGYAEILWNEDGREIASESRARGGGDLPEEPAAPGTNFNVAERWPCEDACFDVVFLSGLEALSCDPMFALSEANRVLKMGGRLVLTAPNLASAKSLQTVLAGESPYVDGRLAARGEKISQLHKREYTTREIKRLAKAAGFEIADLHTHDIYWETPERIFPALAASGYPIGSRGDTIFLTAQKESGVRERFPAKLYNTQATLAEGGRPLRVLVAHENPPRFDQGGAEHRLMQVLRELRNQGHHVTCLAPRGYQKERYAPALEELGIEYYFDDAQVLRREGFDVSPDWTLQQVLREGQFDVAIFYLWFWMCVSIPEHYLDEVRRLSPRTRIMILTDDCHGLRGRRAAELSGLWSDRERAADHGERELEILKRADFALAISAEDRDRLHADVPEAEIGLLSCAVEGGPTGPDFQAREGLIFLADYNNPASRDGVEWYLKDVAPAVQAALPDVKLYLAGVGMTPDLAVGAKNVVRVGFVADLATEFAKRRLLISPVRYGTGIKTKNLHAMAHGVPIVTTAIGAEGMELENEKTAMIADTVEEFARAVVRLYKDRELWTRLAKDGREHMLQRFCGERAAAQLRDTFERARQTTPKRLDAGHTWSVRTIEKYFPEILTHQPAQQRPALRIVAYVQAAEKQVAMGDRAGARRQLRHVFSFVPQRMTREAFFTDFVSVAQRMEKLYRELGEAEGAAAFRREARSFNAASFPEESRAPKAAEPLRALSAALAQKKNMKHKKEKSGIDVSIVIPTFNRCETLRECLEALNRQSLAARRFEAVVVDDGSSDDTPEMLRRFKSAYRLQYFRQANAGAGAARRLAVQRARGKYLLLFNDDTIAEPDLLAVHMESHANQSGERLAVLGDFRLPAAAAERALTHYLSRHPLLFPQVALRAGVHSKNAFFIASNLSVRRDAVLAAGSFDARFRVAEDTELGVRLRQRGYAVLYVPEAKATHQHLSFTIGDLIRRAQIYGRTQLMLLRKHPQLLGDGTGPFGRLAETDAEKIRADAARRQAEVQDATQALEKFDAVDFAPFHAKKAGDRPAADEVMALFDTAVPAVFWFYLFQSFLEAWDEERQHGTAHAQPAAAEEAGARV